MVGRGLPVAVPLLLAGLALFFGGGPGDGSIFWLGAGALIGIGWLLLTVGVPRGWPATLPLAALAVWCAASIGWSGLPDRSWDYANRTVLYALFAALGLWAAARTRALANGLAVLLGAVIVWSLLGKVLPFLYDYGGPDVTRLRGPIGLWNQLALATDYALALALALAAVPERCLPIRRSSRSSSRIRAAASSPRRSCASRGSASRTSGSRAPPR